MSQTLLLTVTALFSGLIATIITLLWQRQNNIKKEKIQIFRTLMSKRYDFTAKECVEAMNMIDVVFYDSKKVRNAWKDFRAATGAPDSPGKPQTIEDKHLRLLETISESIGYKDIDWEDIKQYYYPVALSNRIQDEELLRKAQISASIAQMNQKDQGKATSQIDAQKEFNNQLLMKALDDPDKILKLIEIAEKAQALPNAKKQK